jgi:hypothetical protein
MGPPVDFLDVGIYGPVDRLEARPTLHLPPGGVSQRQQNKMNGSTQMT